MGKSDAALHPGPSIQEYLDRESVPVPGALREEAFQDLGSEDLAVERYFDRGFYEQELERMWTRVWQMACREEEIPQVGDHLVYEIGRTSILVVRSAPDRIQAFYNACLHRGRQLRTRAGNASELRCPFHGFSWSLDGSFKELPCAWDFPQLDPANFRLPELRVDTWGGFVFVNMDAEAEPLADYLGDIPRHFAAWDFENRFKAIHVGQVIAVNWKACAEAFLESFHVQATHPQIMPSTADINTQYDIPESPHWNRMITAMGVPSPYLGDDYPEQQIIDKYAGSGAEGTVSPGQTARQVMAEQARAMWGGMSGRDYSSATDSEMLDAIQYFVFPNFFPWGGYSQNIIYRFRPAENDPEKTFMEVMMLLPCPAEGPRPPPCELHLLDPDEKWTDAPELGPLGPVFVQDMGNLPYVQKGLRSTRKPGVTLARYQESRIRQLHHTLDRYLEGDLGGPRD
jgi:phenylpropionate dioxygenase-like ring-hydroxylating dioxygenase large terminal subunit